MQPPIRPPGSSFFGEVSFPGFAGFFAGGWLINFDPDKPLVNDCIGTKYFMFDPSNYIGKAVLLGVFSARFDVPDGAATGTFTGGLNQIDIHQQYAAGLHTRNMLIHELAHALVFQQNGPQSFAGGQTYEWMKVMVRLGQVNDANFHAGLYPGAMSGFQRAMADTGTRNVRTGQSRPIVTPSNTLAAAEAELAWMQCAEVLMVPPGAGRHGYQLKTIGFRSVRPLPQGSDRISVIRRVGPATLELETLPSSDGSPSLVCLG